MHLQDWGVGGAALLVGFIEGRLFHCNIVPIQEESSLRGKNAGRGIETREQGLSGRRA